MDGDFERKKGAADLNQKEEAVEKGIVTDTACTPLCRAPPRTFNAPTEPFSFFLENKKKHCAALATTYQD